MEKKEIDPDFEAAWAATGYQYGSDALEQVRLGWKLKSKDWAHVYEQGQIRGYREASATAMRRATEYFVEGADSAANRLREIAVLFRSTADEIEELLTSRKR